MTQQVHDAIEHFLADAGLPFKRLDAERWAVQLRGDRKLTIPVLIHVTGDRIGFRSFFMRRPMEAHAHFYEVLLRRNMRAYGVAFAIDADGDVYLAGTRATDGFDADECDRVLGAILVEADGMFDVAIEIGFASYLEADMRWRAKAAEALDGGS